MDNIHTQFHLFAAGLRPMPAIHGYNRGILPEQPNEVECFRDIYTGKFPNNFR